MPEISPGTSEEEEKINQGFSGKAGSRCTDSEEDVETREIPRVSLSGADGNEAENFPMSIDEIINRDDNRIDKNAKEKLIKIQNEINEGSDDFIGLRELAEKEGEEFTPVDLITGWKLYKGIVNGSREILEGMYMKEISMKLARRIFATRGKECKIKGQAVARMIILGPGVRTGHHTHGERKEVTMNLLGDLKVHHPKGQGATHISDKGGTFTVMGGVPHYAENADAWEKIVLVVATWNGERDVLPSYERVEANTGAVVNDVRRNILENGGADVAPDVTFGIEDKKGKRYSDVNADTNEDEFDIS